MLYERPKTYFLCAGEGAGSTRLNAFDEALRAAGIGDINLVRLSSILPPGCDEVPCFRPPAGSLVPTAYAKMTSETPGETIAAAVAIGIPEADDEAGLIMEYHGRATAAEALATVEAMVREGMARRDRAIRRIESTVLDARVVDEARAVFAGVVMWKEVVDG